MLLIRIKEVAGSDVMVWLDEIFGFEANQCHAWRL